MSVDGTDFETMEPGPYVKRINKKYFSHKFRGPGLRYEFGICILTGECVWINGPFLCGKKNDCTIFLEGMANCLESFERVEGDDGYADACPRYTKVPGSLVAKKERKEMASAVRARHETFNKRLKQFASMRHVWHHDIKKHAIAVRAVAVLTQVILHYDKSLFQVDYNN